MASSTAISQKGFIAGRQMNENVVRIDHGMRVQEVMHPSSSCTILFDFMAAFPSVAHQYIWFILDAMCLPKFYIDAIKMLYHNCHCIFRFAGIVQQVFTMFCNVHRPFFAFFGSIS